MCVRNLFWHKCDSAVWFSFIRFSISVYNSSMLSIFIIRRLQQNCLFCARAWKWTEVYWGIKWKRLVKSNFFLVGSLCHVSFQCWFPNFLFFGSFNFMKIGLYNHDLSVIGHLWTVLLLSTVLEIGDYKRCISNFIWIWICWTVFEYEFLIKFTQHYVK